MSKPRRPSGAATAAQTHAYATRAALIASQLRNEIATVPARPHGDPRLVVLMGLPGVGKSHCARLLATRLDAAHVASDELRTRLFIAATYADDENRAIFAAVSALVRSLLADGHRVVVDATNLIARNRVGVVDAARAVHAPVTFVHVVAPEEDARARLGARRSSRAPDDHSEADERVYDRMRAAAFEPPAEGYLELANGSGVEAEVARVASLVEAGS